MFGKGGTAQRVKVAGTLCSFCERTKISRMHARNRSTKAFGPVLQINVTRCYGGCTPICSSRIPNVFPVAQSSLQ